LLGHKSIVSQEKYIEVEGIIPYHYATGVSENLEDESADHTSPETPCPIIQADPGLQAKEYGEDCKVGYVTREFGRIFNKALLEATSLERAGIEVDIVVALVVDHGEGGRLVVCRRSRGYNHFLEVGTSVRASVCHNNEIGTGLAVTLRLKLRTGQKR